MPVSEREYDLMRLNAQLNVRRLIEEWRRNFLGNRMQSPVLPASEPVETTDPQAEAIEDEVTY